MYTKNLFQKKWNNVLAVSQSAFPYKMTDTNFQLEGVVHLDPWLHKLFPHIGMRSLIHQGRGTTCSRTPIYQNMAAWHPLLSGHLRFRPFDEVFEWILAVRFTYCLAEYSTSHVNLSSRGHWFAGPASYGGHSSVSPPGGLLCVIRDREERDVVASP
jgi:hypothetical protein